MNKKNRIYIIMTGVVAITLIWLSQNNKSKETDLELPLDEELSDNIAAENVGTLEGVLWSSGDEAKGNLMLISNNTTIYIRTSRDFNDLVGKHVIASVEGTLDNFTLIDIVENLTKDGFIKTN
ncbi:MAG: hypothetical protein HYX22_02350 [Candidatus Yanofskybacteria bacterium]|nr:hypothetical protein [Candidatus Yanofskybacteria bacterium]